MPGLPAMSSLQAQAAEQQAQLQSAFAAQAQAQLQAAFAAQALQSVLGAAQFSVMMTPAGPVMIPVSSPRTETADWGWRPRRPITAERLAARQAEAEERRVFVGNLLYTAEEEDAELLRPFVKPFGEITECSVIPDRGIGYVTFKKAEDAKTAMEELKGTFINRLTTLKGLNLEYVRKREEEKKWVLKGGRYTEAASSSS